MSRKCENPNVKGEQSSDVVQDDHTKAEQWENYQKNSCRDRRATMLAAPQDRTQYRPTTDSALMKWIVRHAAWLIPRFR